MQQLLINYILHPYTLIVLLVIFYCIYRYEFNKKKTIASQCELNELSFQFLDHYRVRNIYMCFIRLLLYFILNIGILGFIRITRLSYNLDLTCLNPYSLLNLSTILYLILISFCLFYYFKMLRELFFIDIIRLYIYFYHPKHSFYDQVSSIFDWSAFGGIFGNFLSTMSYFVEYMIEEDSRSDKMTWKYSSRQKIWYDRIYQYIYNKNAILKLFTVFNQVIIRNLYKILDYIDVFLHQTPIAVVIFCLLLDIVNKQLHYCYHGLLFISLTRIISTFKKFFRNISLGYCDLHNYFYEGLYTRTASREEYLLCEEKVHNNVTLSEEEKNLMRMRVKQIQYLEYVPEWLAFCMNYAQNEHVRQNGDRLAYSFLVLPVKRIWRWIFTLISLWYICYYRNITIILGSLTIDNNMLAVSILCCLMLTWYYTGYERVQTEDIFIRNLSKSYGPRFYHIIFYLLTTVTIICGLIFFTYINFYTLMCDKLIDIDICSVTINYSINEKVDYIRFMIVQLYPQMIVHIPENLSHILPQISLDRILMYISHIDYSSLLNKEISLEYLRKYSFEFIKEYFVREHVDLLLKDHLIKELYYYNMTSFLWVSLTIIGGLTALIFLVRLTEFSFKLLFDINYTTNLELKAMSIVIETIYEKTGIIINMSIAKKLAILFIKKHGWWKLKQMQLNMNDIDLD